MAGTKQMQTTKSTTDRNCTILVAVLYICFGLICVCIDINFAFCLFCLFVLVAWFFPQQTKKYYF